jgi:sirohydrochlorin cobaltochelatase
MRVNFQKCVILVGHGGIPKDCPPRLISELKRLQAASRGRPTPELLRLEAEIRTWPRTPETDPYKPGLEAVAEALGGRLKDRLVLAAYNEFCAPSLEEAAEAAIARGARSLTIISTMYTRGGSHSEREIPAILESLRQCHLGIAFTYAWPYDIEAVAAMLAGEVLRAEGGQPAAP